MSDGGGDGGAGAIVAVILLLVIIGVAGAAAWYYMKDKKDAAVAPPVVFSAIIENATGLRINVVLPNSPTPQIMEPGVVLPEATFTSGAVISYTFNNPTTASPKTYTSTITTSFVGDKQRWYLTRGGLAKSKSIVSVSNDTASSDSCCNVQGAFPTFTPVLIWGTGLEEVLAPIPPRSSANITIYYHIDGYVPIEFRYTSPLGGSAKVWKYDPVSGPLGDGSNLRLLLNAMCDPIYPTSARCDGTIPTTPVDPNEGPKITFKLGAGVGSSAGSIGDVNTPFKNPMKPDSTDFVIATDETSGTPAVPAGRILLTSAGLTQDKWSVPISSIVNNKLYVGAYNGPVAPPTFGKTTGGTPTEAYKVCKTTSHTLYIWSGKQGINAGCDNPPTPATTACAYTPNSSTGGGSWSCVAHLSEEPGNYSDPCNTDIGVTCDTDDQCKLTSQGGKCWTPRYCDTVTKKCYPVRSETEACTRDAMCKDGMTCNGGYCGSIPIGGACSTNANCSGGLWCNAGKCSAKSTLGGACDPTKASSVTCASADLCCTRKPYVPWEEIGWTESCGSADCSSQTVSRNTGAKGCYKCVPNVAKTDVEDTCPANTGRIGCSPFDPVISCSNPSYTFVRDADFPARGKCIRCPTGYTLNRNKYTTAGVLQCRGITGTYGSSGCVDMCVPAPGSTGAICTTEMPCAL